jgi:drug/metabolite transporter (DMT)-like permease
VDRHRIYCFGTGSHLEGRSLSKTAPITPLLVTLFALLLVADVTSLLSEKLAALSAGPAIGQEQYFYWQLLHKGWTWLALALGPVQLLIWSNILKRSDLSFAYCVSSLCFPATMLAAYLLLKEHIDACAWLGAFLFPFGAALIGSSKQSDDKNSVLPSAEANPELEPGLKDPAQCMRTQKI